MYKAMQQSPPLDADALQVRLLADLIVGKRKSCKTTTTRRQPVGARARRTGFARKVGGLSPDQIQHVNIIVYILVALVVGYYMAMTQEQPDVADTGFNFTSITSSEQYLHQYTSIIPVVVDECGRLVEQVPEMWAQLRADPKQMIGVAKTLFTVVDLLRKLRSISKADAIKVYETIKDKLLRLAYKLARRSPPPSLSQPPIRTSMTAATDQPVFYNAALDAYLNAFIDRRLQLQTLPPPRKSSSALKTT